MPGFHLAKDYLALPRHAQTWLVEPVLPTGGKMNVFSAPKVGKSIAVLQLASAVADPAQADWLGFPVHHHGPVAYFQLDTPRSLWTWRMDKVAPFLPLENVYLCDREESPFYPFNILNRQHMLWLQGRVKALEAVLLVVDVLREFFRGDEGNSDVMQQVLAQLTLAAGSAAQIFITHRRKMGDTPTPLVDMARGSSHLSGAMDGIIHMHKKSWNYISRAVEESKVKYARHHSGLWVVPNTDHTGALKDVLSDANLNSVRERAKELAKKTGWTAEKARSVLRKHLDGT